MTPPDPGPPTVTGQESLAYASTPDLRVAHEAGGPESGHPVILLHGWPDDVRTWDAVLGPLHAAGCRTIRPYLRGFGPTRFQVPETPRTGQLSALGRDVLQFADALGLQRFSLVGHDWGARAAYIASALAPDRVRRCAALSVGWGTNRPDQVLPLSQVQNYWYHWYMSLERGADLVRTDRHNLARHMWQTWSPTWAFTDAEFDATATSFDNPDWAEIVIHSYRVRWGLAAREPSLDALEAFLAADPPISVPTLVIHGGADPCNAPATSADKEHLFRGPYRRTVLDGIGHFPQREDPTTVASHLVEFLAAG